MISTLKRTWAEIHLDHLAWNYHKIRSHVGPEVKFLGVVKADAYGHGSVQISRKLEELGADYLAVSSIDEAMELRLNEIRLPILILGYTPPAQVSRLMEYDITQAVGDREDALAYSREAGKLGGRLKVHIKVDTGMSRLGFFCDGDEFDHAVRSIVEVCDLPGLEAEGIFTHFAVSDEVGTGYEEYTLHQYTLFKKMIDTVEERRGKRFLLRHCSNTGAATVYPMTYLDMVRPGLLLYGYGDHAKMLGLKPVMSLKTTVSAIKHYPAGTRISYGGTYTTDRSARMGVVPYGYADGFYRCLSNRISLMTGYGPVPQRGRVCMDMAMIDLTDRPEVKVGDEIEIFGEANPVEEMASLAGTIPYEITCAVNKRVPRYFMEEGKVIYQELMLRM